MRARGSERGKVGGRGWEGAERPTHMLHKKWCEGVEASTHKLGLAERSTHMLHKKWCEGVEVNTRELGLGI